jgi:hypothetical protein
MHSTVKRMMKKKKGPPKLSTSQATEQIVQMIAQSIASLPKKERLAAMQAFDLTAKAISARGKKPSNPRKSQAFHSAPKRRKKS